MQTKIAALSLLALMLVASPGQSRAETRSADQFVKSSTAAGNFEIMTSNLALTVSGNKEVRNFAQMMVDDHTKMTNQLKEFVHESKVKPMDDTLDPEKKSAFERLKNETGAAFDKDYIALQIKAHQESVDMFSTYAQSGEDARLKEFTTTNLPTLQNHIKAAETLKATSGL